MNIFNRALFIAAAGLTFIVAGVCLSHGAGGASFEQVAYSTEWTTASANPATLYDVHIPTGTIGDWTVCFDTDSRGTHTAASLDWMWKAVISSNTTNNGGPAGVSPRGPGAYISATLGIKCISNSVNHAATILYKE